MSNLRIDSEYHWTIFGCSNDGLQERACGTGSSFPSTDPTVALANSPRFFTMTDNSDRGVTSKPGIKEVAERAGVAISSVSRVLSGHPDVSAAMHDAVTNAVRELGYRPNVLARGLRSQQSMSVGFAVADLANPIFAEIVGGAESELRSAGYSIILTNSEGNADLDAGNIALLRDRQVDGMLLSLTQEDRPESVVAMQSSGIPIVLLDRDRPEEVPALRVVFDHGAGMTKATDHLLDLGHRDFGVIAGGPVLPGRDRRAAIETALWSRGGRSTTVEGNFGVKGGYNGAMSLLQCDPRPTAIIAAGNTLMAGALRAIHELGLDVGRDISFVGCDNVLIAELHQPPIAVVVRDAAMLGQVGAKLLIRSLNAKKQKPDDTLQDVVLPTTFLARSSCAPPSREN